MDKCGYKDRFISMATVVSTPLCFCFQCCFCDVTALRSRAILGHSGPRACQPAAVYISRGAARASLFTVVVVFLVKHCFGPSPAAECGTRAPPSALVGTCARCYKKKK